MKPPGAIHPRDTFHEGSDLRGYGLYMQFCFEDTSPAPIQSAGSRWIVSPRKPGSGVEPCSISLRCACAGENCPCWMAPLPDSLSAADGGKQVGTRCAPANLVDKNCAKKTCFHSCGFNGEKSDWDMARYLVVLNLSNLAEAGREDFLDEPRGGISAHAALAGMFSASNNVPRGRY